MRHFLIPHSLLSAALLSMVIGFAGCKKLIEIPPPETQLASDNVFAENSTAAAVLTGMYAQFTSSGLFTGYASLNLRGALMADELSLIGNTRNQFLNEHYANALTSVSSSPAWSEWYQYINVANTVIAGVSASQTLDSAVKQQLLGESKFIRAFSYFYLVNLYDSVPLALTPDYRVNNLLARSAPGRVYEQITTDLTEAIASLSDHYLAADLQSGTNERVRPTRWAAEALLARAALYTKDYASAVLHAANVIDQTTLFDTTALSDVFLATSTEAIWQLAPNNPDFNTAEGNMFILPGAPNGGNPFYCSPQLLAAFEPGDARLHNWVGSVTDNGTYYFPFKFKIPFGGPPTEYVTMLRLAELYLIRAEAYAYLNDLPAANDDLNVLRKRARLPQVNYTNQQNMLTSILHERQVELFTEWGHRWFDLKRTGTINDVMPAVCTQKGTTWKNTAALLPIPRNDLERDIHLTQNNGY